jgi:hypothetical protein
MDKVKNCTSDPTIMASVLMIQVAQLTTSLILSAHMISFIYD